jgi:hypothetical protein
MGLDRTIEGDSRYHSRKSDLSLIIKDVTHRRGDASMVEILVFSARYGRLAFFAARSTSERNRFQFPQTPFAEAREHGRSRRKSRDGEMFMLDHLDGVLDDYVAGHTEPDGVIPRDDLRIEMIGPQGTCTDCQAALRLWLDDVNGWCGVHFPLLGVSLRTRWTSGQQVRGNMRPDARDQSHVYGSPNAYAKGGVKGSYDEWGAAPRAEHHKLRF